jgi:hypothetical protein
MLNCSGCRIQAKEIAIIGGLRPGSDLHMMYFRQLAVNVYDYASYADLNLGPEIRSYYQYLQLAATRHVTSAAERTL